MIGTAVFSSATWLVTVALQDVNDRFEQFGAYRADSQAIDLSLPWVRTAQCAVFAQHMGDRQMYWYFQNYSIVKAVEHFGLLGEPSARDLDPGVVADYGARFEAGYMLGLVRGEAYSRIERDWHNSNDSGCQMSWEETANSLYSMAGCMDEEYVACEDQFPGQCGGPPDHQVFDDEY